MRRNIKQFLCKHKEFKIIATHKFTQQNLWYCPKCKVYYIQHYGIGLGYYSQTPHLEHWDYDKNIKY